MVNGWVKSMRCKSTAADDVYPASPPPPRRRHRAGQAPAPALLASGCGHSSTLRDVVAVFPKQQPVPRPIKSRTRARPIGEPSSSSPALAELPVGHSSRRVVELIFSSSWCPKGTSFTGAVEMVFKVRNPAKTVARFEEYRDGVRAKAGADDARCAANGNEMMRFHSAGEGPVYEEGIAGIRTFAGSGGAHESAAGGKRRAMLLSRVIAGRVRGQHGGAAAEFESVSGAKGELVVFDQRAILACFLIIYAV
ncbi:uncharacterized protein LOC144716737 [Wolffia australiana]